MSVDALLAAIQQGDLARARELVEQDVELRGARDSNGVSLLMKALYHRQSEIASLLATGRNDLDLDEAVALGDLERVARLLEEEPESIERRSADGFTPLHYAAFFSQPEAARRLIEQGAELSVAAANPMKVHPLHSAAASGATEICRRLLEAGADPDARQEGGFTALMAAAMSGNEALIEILLEHGADRSLESDDGKTALAFAREKDQQRAAALLEI